MRLRSFDQLDIPLAWRRTRGWAQGGGQDVPDRLPFEVLDRMFGDEGPPLAEDFEPNVVTLVASSKKSGLARNFARLSPLDLVLYQALVDQLAGDIEAALPSRDVALAYRQTTGREDDAFAGTPGRKAYGQKLQSIVDYGFGGGDNFAITADVAGYFMHVEIDELERLLLSISDRAAVIKDLGDLLRLWQALGLNGLPQGLRPSSPLGNLYLTPLDKLLEQLGARYVRWMDDFVVAAGPFFRAREILDAIEQELYRMRLTLAADKTRIRRYEVAYVEAEDARARLQRLKAERQDGATSWVREAAEWMDYPPNEVALPEPATLDRDVVVELYDQLLSHLDDDDLPRHFQADVVASLRELQALREARGIEHIPQLLRRAPDLTGEVLRYVASVARASHQAACVAAFTTLLEHGRFMRDAEKLNLCAAVLALPTNARSAALAVALGDWALGDGHPLVRARALLAWGAQSAANDFSVVDEFWVGARAPWRPYALVAVQAKDKSQRDARYARWSGTGRFSGSLAELLRQAAIGWRKL